MVAIQIEPVKAITVDALVDKCHAAYFVILGVDTNAITRSIKNVISAEDDDDDVRDDIDDVIDEVIE